jgi:hypothetical protein
MSPPCQFRAIPFQAGEWPHTVDPSREQPSGKETHSGFEEKIEGFHQLELLVQIQSLGDVRHAPNGYGGKQEHDCSWQRLPQRADEEIEEEKKKNRYCDRRDM